MTPQRRPKDAGIDWWEIGLLVALFILGLVALLAVFGAYWLFRVAK